MKETYNADELKACNADYCEDEDEGDTSSSIEVIVIDKPKKGFVDNELFSDDNMDISNDTLKNNIDTIANLQEDDIELSEIMDDSFKGNKNDTKADKDDKLNLFNRSGVSNSEKHDVSNSEKRDVSNSEKCDVNGEDPDAWRIDNTPGVFDPRWRIKMQSYPNCNTSTGLYKKTLEEIKHC